MAKTTEKYLLVLCGPVNSIPVGLYDTGLAALTAAADHGIPKNLSDLPYDCEGDDDRQSLGDAVDRGPFTFNDLGVPLNNRPLGYVIVRFVDGRVDGYHWVNPHADYDVVLPGTTDGDPGTIDPTQELHF